MLQIGLGTPGVKQSSRLNLLSAMPNNNSTTNVHFCGKQKKQASWRLSKLRRAQKGSHREIQTSSYFTMDPILHKCKHTILSETFQHWAEHPSKSVALQSMNEVWEHIPYLTSPRGKLSLSSRFSSAYLAYSYLCGGLRQYHKIFFIKGSRRARGKDEGGPQGPCVMKATAWETEKAVWMELAPRSTQGDVALLEEMCHCGCRLWGLICTSHGQYLSSVPVACQSVCGTLSSNPIKCLPL